jgi:transcriptional regulator with XRE-family HTH domain
MNDNPSGLALKIERVTRRAKANALAEAMGVSKSRVAAIEREQFPSAETVARYRAALDTCAPSPTSEAA